MTHSFQTLAPATVLEPHDPSMYTLSVSFSRRNDIKKCMSLNEINQEIKQNLNPNARNYQDYI